jgi:long-chain acyl-CoA synthetase
MPLALAPAASQVPEDLMADVAALFALLPKRYRPGVLSAPRTYYFSVGDHKYTVRLTPEVATVESGRTVANADVVLKTTPELFEAMVVRGRMPGAFDVTMGRIKTNDPVGLAQLRELFDFRA